MIFEAMSAKLGVAWGEVWDKEEWGSSWNFNQSVTRGQDALSTCITGPDSANTTWPLWGEESILFCLTSLEGGGRRRRRDPEGRCRAQPV